MDPQPSPFERLLQLEEEVAALNDLQLPVALRQQSFSSIPSRQVWPADELLLTRLLRRSPVALAAYQGAADLCASDHQGLSLTAGVSASAFQFCELVGGDAVVWVKQDPPSWVWHSQVFQKLFVIPSGAEYPRPLILQSLPLFKPVVRGQRWTLFQQGEMVPELRSFPEREEQVNLLRRLESMERMLIQQKAQSSLDIGELRTQVRVLQDQIKRLTRLKSNTNQ